MSCRKVWGIGGMIELLKEGMVIGRVEGRIEGISIGRKG